MRYDFLHICIVDDPSRTSSTGDLFVTRGRATCYSARGAAEKARELLQRHVQPRDDDMRDLQSGPATDTGESQLLGLSQATRDRKSIRSRDAGETIFPSKGREEIIG